MIIEFVVENYRSIKSEQVLSLIADSGRKKKDNVIDLPELRLLRSAVIYGHNASGKSNVIKAFQDFLYLIKKSTNFQRGDSINSYDPFRLTNTTIDQPTRFCLDFIHNNTKYTYEFSFTSQAFTTERLISYSKISSEQGITLFSRDGSKIDLHKQLSNLKTETQILPNRLFLSEIGGNTNKSKILGDIYLFFRKNTAHDTLDNFGSSILKHSTTQRLLDKENTEWKNKLEKLLRVADIKIEGIRTKEISEEQFQFPESIPDRVKKQFIKDNQFRLYTTHQAYNEQKNKIELVEFDFEEESQGTQNLFALGGLILYALQEGVILWVDEFENSLHPKLSKFLVSLFHNPHLNPKNAQLIFTTHETTLLSKDLFRKDQIWFTTKDKFGETELYSTQDFDGIRDDIPFEKWYMEGKFGAQPNIKELEFTFDE